MKGLLIKDLKCLFKSKYIFTLIILLCSVAAMISLKLFFEIENTPDIISSISLIQIFSSFFASYSVLFILQSDEKYGWNKYELILPVSKQILVAEKYVVPYIFVAIAAFSNSVIFSTFLGLSTVSHFINWFLYQFSLGMIIPLFAIPLYYKFGYYKSKFMLIIVIFIAMSFSIFDIQLGNSISSKIVEFLNIQTNSYQFNFYFNQFLKNFFNLLFIAILNLISYSLSLFFYKRKVF